MSGAAPLERPDFEAAHFARPLWIGPSILGAWRRLRSHGYSEDAMTRRTDRRRPPARDGHARVAPVVHAPAVVRRLAGPSAWSFARLLLLGLAAAWRLAYLARLRHTPFAGSLNADARIYWSWSEFVLHHGLWPPAPFYLAPLYPYVLAGWRALGAGGTPQVLAIQALIGAAAVVFLADATARLAGRWPAVAVGVVLALHESTTFFDGLVLPESLMFFLESLLVWFVVRTDWSRTGSGPFAVYGLLVGVLAQGRASNALLLALVIPLAGTRHAESARRLRAAALALTTFTVVCLPSAVANYHAGREPIPFTYNLGFNLYVGNNPDADGAWVEVTRGSTPVPLEGSSPVTGGALDGRAFLLASQGRRLSPAESSARWAQMAAGFVRSAPARALALAGRKLLLAWTWRELPQIESRKSLARAAGPLGLPVVGTFGCLAILGLSGAAWAARRGAAERWLVRYAGLITLALVPFFVTDRYRHHLLPALAVLAGVAIAEITRAARGADRGERSRRATDPGGSRTEWNPAQRHRAPQVDRARQRWLGHPLLQPVSQRQRRTVHAAREPDGRAVQRSRRPDRREPLSAHGSERDGRRTLLRRFPARDPDTERVRGSRRRGRQRRGCQWKRSRRRAERPAGSKRQHPGAHRGRALRGGRPPAHVHAAAEARRHAGA